MRIGSLRSLALGLSLAALLAACGADEGGGDGAAQGSAAEPSPPAEASTVQVVESDFGSILADADGMTLYLFEADEGSTSSCYDDCAAAWPALESDSPTGGEGVDASLLGTTERDDGTTQVTYAGHPLYYYAADGSAGDVTGQGINDVWFVVGPDGAAVTEKAQGQDRPGY
jgi:predicted lipoprotein with Yx(FWY)xxD motif